MAKLELVKIEAQSAAESAVLQFGKWKTNKPTDHLILEGVAVITSGTTPGGAWLADSPGALFDEIQVSIGGVATQSFKGYHAYRQMMRRARLAPHYVRTTWGASTALSLKFRLKIPLGFTLKRGVSIEVKVTMGSRTLLLTGGAHAWTSCTVTAYQGVWSELSGQQEAEIRKQRRYLEVSYIQKTIGGTNADFDDMDLAPGGKVESILCRIYNNTALSDSLITSYQVERDAGDLVDAEIGEATWAAETVDFQGVAKETGYYWISFDRDGDKSGLLDLGTANKPKIRYKNGSPTGTAYLPACITTVKEWAA